MGTGQRAWGKGQWATDNGQRVWGKGGWGRFAIRLIFPFISRQIESGMCCISINNIKIWYMN